MKTQAILLSTRNIHSGKTEKKMCDSGAGWEQVASRNQEERSLADIGSTTPSHLTKVLYIPNHDGSTSHYPIHAITGQYKDTVENRMMGTASYVVSLGKIPKPQAIGDGIASPFENAILYNVYFNKTSDNNASLDSVSVVPSSSTSDPVLVETDVYVYPLASTNSANRKYSSNPETSESTAAAITMKRQGNTATADRPIRMSISYPIPPLTWRKAVYVHPYFAFQPPEEEKAHFEWQLHPVPHGRLRYTLVRVRGMQSADNPVKPSLPSDHEILAIYHHIGDGVSLPLPYSEGILLLSGDMKPEIETLVVASVFGMLGELRRLSKLGKRGDSSKESKEGRFGFVKGLLNRK